jgi:DNA polymerase III psi subunit
MLDCACFIAQKGIFMLDDGRLALLAPLGIQEWHLRRPEQLAVQGFLPAAATEVVQQEPVVWLVGSEPGWLADFFLALGWLNTDCRPWLPGEALAQGDLLLLNQIADEARTTLPEGAICLDADAGKRALWLQLCHSGLLREPSDA